jgi:hypothetical protein
MFFVAQKSNLSYSSKVKSFRHLYYLFATKEVPLKRLSMVAKDTLGDHQPPSGRRLSHVRLTIHNSILQEGKQ